MNRVGMKFKRIVGALMLVLLVAGLIGPATIAAETSEPWSFAVMSDTQWKSNLDGENPETVAVGIINQLNDQFIDAGVNFVLQVGDLVDKETDSPNGYPANRTLDTRAAAAQPLYDAGIGFFPLRGNHEGSALAATEVQALFPQTQTGVFTKTDGTAFSMGSGFSSPSTNLAGLSYAFTYNNATFVLLDQFTPTDSKASDGSTYSQSNNAISSQQPWITSTLNSKPGDSHAFIFSHKQLFGGNHTDTLFGSPTSNAAAQDAFIASLDDANVGYLFSGHDHMHNLSVVTSPDAAAEVHQVICASNSYKFYTPVSLGSHGTDTVGYNSGKISKNREVEVSQELWSVGYYIVTIDGQSVTVDFYSADPISETPGLEDIDLVVTPALTFHKIETFGYSLNGKEFQVAQGGSYTSVADTFGTTSAKILSGTNASTAADYNGRGFTQLVETGWNSNIDNKLRSNTLSLTGMSKLVGAQTDTYTLSMTYEQGKTKKIGEGAFGIGAIDANGNWVNAVDLNYGGLTTFVEGSWDASYSLGTYGIDTDTKTAWAVINYNGSFAVANGVTPAAH